MLRDRVMNGNGSRILKATYGVLSRLQDSDPALQVQSGAVMLYALCEVLGLDPKEMLEMGERVVSEARKERSEHMRALEMYLEGELK